MFRLPSPGRTVYHVVADELDILVRPCIVLASALLCTLSSTGIIWRTGGGWYGGPATLAPACSVDAAALFILLRPEDSQDDMIRYIEKPPTR